MPREKFASWPGRATSRLGRTRRTGIRSSRQSCVDRGGRCGGEHEEERKRRQKRDYSRLSPQPEVAYDRRRAHLERRRFDALQIAVDAGHSGRLRFRPTRTSRPATGRHPVRAAISRDKRAQRCVSRFQGGFRDRHPGREGDRCGLQPHLQKPSARAQAGFGGEAPLERAQRDPRLVGQRVHGDAVSGLCRGALDG